MFTDRYSAGLWERATFDPLSMTAIGLSVAGGALSAGGTLAAGNTAAQAGKLEKAAADYKATQLRQNAALAIRGGQVQAADTELKTKAAISSSTARAAASGVDAGVGSPATNVGEIAKRGSYLASMDLWRGRSQASGLLNAAQAATYEGDVAELEGEEKKKASYLAAAGTLAGSAGSSLGTYAKNS
jgi:hypothetical protein